MIERDVEIINKLGLHARAAAKLVQLLGSFKSNSMLEYKGRQINGKSIMGVMMLAAGLGATIKLRIDGVDETSAMDAAVDLFARRFDEGQ